MVTLGFQKKEKDVNDTLATKKTSEGKSGGGFFRNNKEAAPPVSTPDTVKSHLDEFVDTVVVPKREHDSSLPRNRNEMNSVDSVVSELTGPPQDPPGEKVRSGSIEGGASGSSSGFMLTSPEVDATPAPAKEESIVSRVLGIVDMSCVSSGFVPEPDPPPRADELRHVLSFKPEWGVAPDHDEFKAPASISGTSSTKRALAIVAASAATARTPPRSRGKSPEPERMRRENFELVYTETTPKAAITETTKNKSNALSDFMKKLRHDKKNESTSLGIARRDSSRVATPPERVAESGNLAMGLDSSSGNQDKTLRKDKPERPKVEPVIEPVEYRRPVTSEKKGQNMQILRKALSGKSLKRALSGQKHHDENSPQGSSRENAATTTEKENSRNAAKTSRKKKNERNKNEEIDARNAPSKMFRRNKNERNGQDNGGKTSNKNDQQPQQEQQSYKKVLKSIKASDLPLETVPEEDEENELKVRVPGIQTAGAFITGKDLIGDEVVEEIYGSIDREIEQEEQKTRHIVTSETSEIVLPATSEPEPLTTADDSKEDIVQKADVSHLDLEVKGISRSKTWKERLGLKTSEEISSWKSLDSGEALARNRSSPGQILSEAFKGAPKKKKKAPQKPEWKAVIDPATGKTYYYHRKTRETTWKKPEGVEIGPPKVPKKEVEGAADENNDADIQDILRKKGPRDFDPIVWEKKQEIARLIAKMASTNGSTVERLVAEYDGREDELLNRLRDLADSKPFDEPVQTGSDPHNRADEKSFASRARTGVSMYSGFSGKYSQRSKISETTQQIKNTARGKPFIGSNHTTSISSKNDGVQSPVNGSPTRIPQNIPVPRLRELNVEEFTTSDRIYGAKTTRPRRTPYVKPVPKDDGLPQPYSEFQQGPDSNAYLGDNEDTDKDSASYAATDSISALSEADLSFVDRKESFLEDARRKALDRAIAQEDWDLAAQLSEGMRSGKTASNANREVPREWAQSEMDRFISENDWDAVAAYIAQIRANSKEVEQRNLANHIGKWKQRVGAGGRGDSSKMNQEGRIQQKASNVSEGGSPQRRFGARSQLQHTDLSVSTNSSYSTYDSEYTSASSYTDEEPPPKPQPISGPASGRPKEFAC